MATERHGVIVPILRYFSPKLLQVILCFGALPLIFALSLAAGAIVWTTVSVGWEAPLYLQYGDGGSPYAIVQLPLISTGLTYDISVFISVPATESNFHLGNFMTSLELRSVTNETIAHARRPAIVLAPKTGNFVSSLFTNKGPNLVNIDVPLLPSFTPRSSSISAHVEIGRRDRWTTIGSGEGRELSIHSASIRGVVRPRGIHALVSRFPIIASIISASLFFFISTMTFLIFNLVSLRSSRSPSETVETSRVLRHLAADSEEINSRESSSAVNRLPSPEPERPVTIKRHRLRQSSTS